MRITSEVDENDEKRCNEKGSGYQRKGSKNNNVVMGNGMEIIGFV